ncbi:MAG: universal stress protein [Micropruina sp.]|nr:universal stress protein [Micropruina sp.]
METVSSIVVGNDGSALADVALRRGLWLAQQIDAPVRILRAWSISSAPRPKTWELGYAPPLEDFEEAVRERLVADTAAALADYPDVPVTLETPHGKAVRELLEAAAEGARLVIVGSRGLGGFSGLLLGSVSRQVVEHAVCDVLVVRPSGDRAPAATRAPDSQLA